MGILVKWRNPLISCFAFLLLVHSWIFAENQNGTREGRSQSEDSNLIRVDVDFVTTDITVMGNAVLGLKKEDFVVYDNKVAQNLSYFSQDQLPLAVALVIDTSGSVVPLENELRIAALTALHRLKPEDQVVLYSFGESSHRLSDLTEDRLQIANLLSHFKISGGGTNIYGALYDATRYIRKEAAHRRKAIILISDNVHNTGHDEASCQTELLENSITLYSIVIDWRNEIPIHILQKRWKWRIPKSISTIRQMAEETGGGVFEVKGLMSVKTAFEDAISRLRMQYTLGFNPSDHGPDGQ